MYLRNKYASVQVSPGQVMHILYVWKWLVVFVDMLHDPAVMM